MPQLLSPQDAAEFISASLAQVYVWMRRADDPLPSVPVGKSGKHRRVIAEQIQPWLDREARRDQPPKHSRR